MARDASYVKAPIAVVFATSNRSNARIKMKVLRNKNIDYLIGANFVVPGIPAKSIIKEVGVGEAFIEKYKKKYKLK